MFRLNSVENEQMSLFSKESLWTPYMQKRMDESWAGMFRKNIFPKIGEKPYAPLYSTDNASCPNTPVNVLVGLLVIKSLTGQSDEEVIDSLYFDERFQYALYTINKDKQPISKNMLNIFRGKIRDYEKETGINLIDETMREINEEILKLCNVDRSIQRIDSMMVSSSCKKMTRIDLVYTVNYNFVKLLNKQDKVPEEYKCYLETNNKNDVIYRTKVDEEDDKLSTLLQNSLSLYDAFKEDEEVNKSEEFELLERLIKEQYDSEKEKPKEGKEIKSDSLQNPSDKEATYRYKYGDNYGYSANIVEAVNKGNPMIIDWDVDTNITSDTEFLERYIDKKIESENTDKVVQVVDGAYYSDELNKKAKEADIELHPTELTGRKPKESNLSEFVIDEETHQVLECPTGNAPTESNYNEETEVVTAKFEKSTCENCPHRDKCPLNFEQKKANSFRAELSKIENSKLRAKQGTEEYQKVSNMRAGIEGTVSVLRRKYHIDFRGAKGLLRLKIEFSTSIVAMNIKRACKMAKKSANILEFLEKILERLKFCYVSVNLA